MKEFKARQIDNVVILAVKLIDTIKLTHGSINIYYYLTESEGNMGKYQAEALTVLTERYLYYRPRPL